MNEARAKDRRVTRQRYDEYQKARAVYSRAKREADAEVGESLEPLRAVRDDARDAYRESLAVLMEYTTPYPKPGDPVPPLPGESA